MNKLTKGAIATAAGVILLMGGAGTLAYWNDSDNVLASGQQITAGNLDVTALSTPASAWTVKPWTGTTAGTAQTIADISTFRMVPGDTVEYTKSVTVTVTGQTLKSELTLVPGAITSTSNALSTELAGNAKVEIVGALPTGVSLVSAGVYSIAPGTYTLPLKAVVAWPESGVAGDENAAKTLSVTFGAFAVQLKQVFS